MIFLNVFIVFLLFVGCTKNIQQRFKAHLNPTRDLNTPKRQWIKELRELGLKPTLSVIENVDDTNSLIREKYYIQHFRALGYPLTNTGEIEFNGNQTSFREGYKNEPVIAIALDGSYFNSYPSVSIPYFSINFFDNTR